MNKVPRWVFRYVGNKTFDFSSKKRIFCSKTTKFSPKLAFLSIAGSFGALLVGWLVVVARAVSRKTPIYFILLNFNLEVGVHAYVVNAYVNGNIVESHFKAVRWKSFSSKSNQD